MTPTHSVRASYNDTHPQCEGLFPGPILSLLILVCHIALYTRSSDMTLGIIMFPLHGTILFLRSYVMALHPSQSLSHATIQCLCHCVIAHYTSLSSKIYTFVCRFERRPSPPPQCQSLHGLVVPLPRQILVLVGPGRGLRVLQGHLNVPRLYPLQTDV